MKGAILSIGDELLIGQVLNSNAQWISEKLTDLGISVTFHLTCGDQTDAITTALDHLLPQVDVLIIGGGLGPTHDDLTLEVLSKYFSMPLYYDEEWVKKIEDYFRSRNRVMTNNNKKQGNLLQGAARIDNSCGTAAGQYFQKSAKHIFVVPGVPHEMKAMAEIFIFPRLTSLSASQNSSTAIPKKILKQTLCVTGIGESALAEKCAAFVTKVKSTPNLTLAFLPSTTEIRLRLQMKTESDAEEKIFVVLVEELRTQCGPDFFGFEPVHFEALIVRELQKRQQTLACAESCTGGYVSHRLTQISGSSDVFKGALVTYQSGVKEQELGVTSKMIEDFGIVSEPVAQKMAESIRKKWNTTYGIGITGYLGETAGDIFAPAGTVWIALSTASNQTHQAEKTISRCFHFELNRERGTERAARAALDLLRRQIHDS